MHNSQCYEASKPYLKEIGVEIVERPFKIQFTNNASEPIHRWAPYIQGFSASFVKDTLVRYRSSYEKSHGAFHVHDPFAGCGTVSVEAKRNGVSSSGTELNPLLHFVTNLKIDSLSIDPSSIKKTYSRLRFDKEDPYLYPSFLETTNQFDSGPLKSLSRIKGAIDRVRNTEIQNLFKLAFAGILIECSKLKRTPCLGYNSKKKVSVSEPFRLFEHRIWTIISDIRNFQAHNHDKLATNANVSLADATEFKPQDAHLVITSPPYMNGIDYVMNYKIEMAWLDFAKGQEDLKELKNKMVACDNISRAVTRNFSERSDKYTNPWIEDIINRLKVNVENWGPEQKSLRIQRNRNGKASKGYRRKDMPEIVAKYFDDMYKVFCQVKKSLLPGGRFILVVGDSYIADVYVPTDLIMAKMGTELGFKIESIEKARNRRSGQIQSFKLRETILTLAH